VQEMVAVLVGTRSAELRNPQVPRIQWADRAPDRAALAGRVPPFAYHAQRQAELGPEKGCDACRVWLRMALSL
jgi:hypothetical protein